MSQSLRTPTRIKGMTEEQTAEFVAFLDFCVARLNENASATPEEVFSEWKGREAAE